VNCAPKAPDLAIPSQYDAESGRAMLGSLSGGQLALQELHRFPNTPVRVPGALYWDTLRLWYEIQHGIDVAARERKLSLDGIGIDTWGVDFGLLGRGDTLLGNPAAEKSDV
jgi:rhamnulokinase